MFDHGDTGQRGKADEFAEYAEQPSTGILREFWELLRHNKKWFLLPVLVVLLLMGLLVVIGGSSAAMFIYPFF